MDFNAWLERNKEILEGRSSDEIARLAIEAGNDRIVVAQWLTQQKFLGEERI